MTPTSSELYRSLTRKVVFVARRRCESSNLYADAWVGRPHIDTCQHIGAKCGYRIARRGDTQRSNLDNRFILR